MSNSILVKLAGTRLHVIKELLVESEMIVAIIIGSIKLIEDALVVNKVCKVLCICKTILFTRC